MRWRRVDIARCLSVGCHKEKLQVQREVQGEGNEKRDHLKHQRRSPVLKTGLEEEFAHESAQNMLEVQKEQAVG